MSITMKLEGFSNFEKELAKLEKLASRRAVAIRAMRKAAQPMADIASSLAPVDTGTLANSVIVGTKLDGRQSRIHKRMFKHDKTSVEMFVGPSYLRGDGGRHGHLQEFGTKNHGPKPFMRPAWDQDHMNILRRLGGEMAKEIDKAVTRQARKAARG